MPVDPLGNYKPLTAADLSNMDLETALMAVQTQRADLLEVGLKEQMDAVRKRNDEIANCNAVLAELNSRRPEDDDEVAANTGNDIPGTNPPASLYSTWKSLGLGEDQYKHGKITKEEFDSMIQTVKSRIDTLNNSQQQDMLRMQSMMNKRNEAYELMTNFIKKMQESRSGILGNMR